MSKHHKKNRTEEGQNSLLNNIDINQVIQLLANMNRKPNVQGPVGNNGNNNVSENAGNGGNTNGLTDGLGNILQTLLSSMKKEENVIKPDEVIVQDEEPEVEEVELYKNEELNELIEQLKVLISTLQNNIEHKQEE